MSINISHILLVMHMKKLTNFTRADRQWKYYIAKSRQT